MQFSDSTPKAKNTAVYGTPSNVVIPAQLICMYEHSQEPWAVKDLNSRFVYANRKYCELAALDGKYNIEGDLDYDVPSTFSDYAEHHRNHDRLAIESGELKASLEIHKYGKNRITEVYHFNKAPFYDSEGNVVGSYFHGRRAENISVDIFINRNERNGAITLYEPSDIFSPSEWLVVFLLMRNKTQKEIASILDVTLKRVNKRVCSIYLKSGVYSASQLCDFVRCNGWHNFVPERFALKGHILLS